MEEEIFISVLSEELDILRSLKNRLFDLPYEMDEEDKRGELITCEARRISAICDALQQIIDTGSV